MLQLSNNYKLPASQLNSVADLAVYVHYPFCKSKCPYCDFNSHLEQQTDHSLFFKGYEAELDFFKSNLRNRKITSIFFGGGTPSLMPVSFADKILQKINNLWSVSSQCEVTIEANPTSFEANKFRDFHKIGFNRLSLGIQSLNQEDLNFLGRQHTVKESILAISQAREIFDNFSFDLIYARPKQKINDWKIELETAIKLGSNHLSLYQLTIEKGTKFFNDWKEKKFIMPTDKLAGDFYQTTNEIMADNGFNHYEISNYAKENYQSVHNLSYWQGVDYIGIGAGSHSRVFFDRQKHRKAIVNLHRPDIWLEQALNNKTQVAIQKIEEINDNDLKEELILTGLRTIYGVDIERLNNFFKQEIFDDNILKKLLEQGFITINKQKIAIAKNYWIFANSVIEKVISALKK